MEFLKQNLVFVREFIQDFDNTGSFCPTSKWAARALLTPLEDVPRTGKRIIEAGPGTGSVTVHILANMRDDDELAICEINPRFMRSLKQTLATNKDFLRHKDRVSFFEGAIQDLPPCKPFDLIVCAIPFLNLDFAITKSIFDKFRNISHSGTSLTYYEYMGLRKLGKAVSPIRRKRYEQLEGFFSVVHEENLTSKQRVWLNLLPINVYRVDRLAA